MQAGARPPSLRFARRRAVASDHDRAAMPTRSTAVIAFAADEAERYLDGIDGPARPRPRRRGGRGAPSGARSPRTASAPIDGAGGARSAGFGGTRALGRAAVLPLRERRHDAGGARRGLARDRARPEPRRVGLLAARRPARAGRARLAEGALRAAGVDGAACSPPARRWRTSSRSRAPGAGAAPSRASTSTRTASAACRRSRCSAPGYMHPSDVKALGDARGGAASGAQASRATGSGGSTSRRSSAQLAALGGAPAVVIASAGEVNAGDFDPIDAMADLAERYGAWFHVDGAFGLFAALSPSHRAPRRGRGARRLGDRRRPQVAERSLRVRLRVRERRRAAGPRSSRRGAAYLPDPLDPKPTWGYLGPEMSRRARAFPVWATLRAYGRSGYRAIVERHLDLAQHLARTGRRGARPRTARRRAAEHRVLPLPPERHARTDRAGRAEPPDRRGGDRGRAGVLRLDATTTGRSRSARRP